MRVRPWRSLYPASARGGLVPRPSSAGVGPKTPQRSRLPTGPSWQAQQDADPESWESWESKAGRRRELCRGFSKGNPARPSPAQSRGVRGHQGESLRALAEMPREQGGVLAPIFCGSSLGSKNEGS